MIIFEIIFIIGFGTLLALTYNWSFNNRLIGYFSAVNQSVWERLKTLAVPMFLTMVLDFGSFGYLKNYWFAKFIAVVLALLLALGIMYLYKTFVKQTTLTHHVVSIAISAIYATLMFNNILEMSALNLEIVGMVGLAIIFVMFALLTEFPLKNRLFIDPITKKYGFGWTREDLAKRYKKTKKVKVKKSARQK